MRGRRANQSSNGKMIAGIATLSALGIATAFFLSSETGNKKLSSFLAWAAGRPVAAEAAPPALTPPPPVAIKKPQVSPELAKAIKEAETALSQGEFDLAETKARKAKGIDPQNEQVAKILDKISSARQKVELARRKKEHDQEIRAARDDLIAEKLDDATTHVDKASNAMPDSLEVPPLRQEIAAAKEKLAALKKEREENIKEYVRRGTVHYSKNEFSEAIELADRALGVEPEYEPAITLRAESIRGQELLEAKKAEEEAAKLAAEDTTDEDAEDDTNLTDLDADEKDSEDNTGLVDLGADEKEDGLVDLGADDTEDDTGLVDLDADEKEDGLIDLGADDNLANKEPTKKPDEEPTKEPQEERGLIDLGADKGVEPPRPTTSGDVPEATKQTVLWDDPLEDAGGLIDLGADKNELEDEPIEEQGLVVVDDADPAPKKEDAKATPVAKTTNPTPKETPKSKTIKATSVEAPWISAGAKTVGTNSKQSKTRTFSSAASAAIAPLGKFDKAMQKEDVKALAATLSPEARRIYFKRDEMLDNASEFFKIASDISIARKVNPVDVKVDKDTAKVASRYTITFTLDKTKISRSYIGRYEMKKLKDGWFISRVVTEGLSK